MPLLLLPLRTPLGTAALAADGRAVRRILLPRADARAAEAALRRAFPEGELLPEPPASGPLAEAAAELRAYFRGGARELTFPVALAGISEHDRRTLAAMRRIPYGEVRSYAWLAREAGSHPRAAGGACARNPLPLYFP